MSKDERKDAGGDGAGGPERCGENPRAGAERATPFDLDDDLELDLERIETQLPFGSEDIADK